MREPPTTAERINEIQDSEYQQAISRGLDKAYAEAFVTPWPFQIGTDRLIIFSDLHKGGRNDADDFQRCERAYNAALGYYYALGYTLAELGDVEELWEERPRTVIDKYERTLRLSAKFHIDPDQRGSRYLRVWGNHDDHWNLKHQVEKYLQPIYCPAGTAGLDVHGSVRIEVRNEAGQKIGELFLAHGHQGTFESDKASWFSRLVVRYVWRPWQRLTNMSLNTPAKDWVLREKHNLAMHRWASGLNRGDIIFIAGHTHKPVFLAQSKADVLAAEIRRAEQDLREKGASADRLSRLADLSAQLEWTRAEGPDDTGKDGIIDVPRACYFNTGCAAYLDGDVTGLELVGDEIRLVRWPEDDGAPRPKTLAQLRLSTLFGVPPAVTA